jgi:3-oxoadipate enol-lactonase
VEDAFGPRVEQARRDGNMEAMTQATLERWFGTAWMDAHAQETARMRSLMLGTSVDGFEACCHALRSETFDLRPLFAQVGAAVEEALCVVGERDANLPQAMEVMRGKMEEGFRAAGKDDNKVELKVIRDAGHVCFIDGYEQFMQVITTFLTT